MNIERIIFLQDDSETTKEALKIFDEEGYLKTIEYLSQWHFPGEHETSNELGHGTADRIYKYNGYILSVNLGLNYIGLEYQEEVRA